MIAKLIAVSMTIGLIGLILIMQLTTPATIHPIGLLAFFVCLYILMAGIFGVLIRYFSKISSSLASRMRSLKRQPLSLVQSYRYGTVVAFAPVVLLAMQTVGGIQPLDVLFVVLFVGVALFYVAKRS